MTSLLPRLQALTAPSREIDAEIALANGWTKHPHYYEEHQGEYYWRSPTNRICPNVARYTESLDAAKLLAGDLPWQVGTDPEGGFGASCLDQWAHSDANDAIALLIAIMKAREESKT